MLFLLLVLLLLLLGLMPVLLVLVYTFSTRRSKQHSAVDFSGAFKNHSKYVYAIPNNGGFHWRRGIEHEKYLSRAASAIEHTFPTG